MAPVCGIAAATHPRSRAALRDVARVDDPLGHGHLAARARHRQRALPDRAVDDDGPDRTPGTGLHPLRGQNNVQGASDVGPDPDDVSRLPARRQRRQRAKIRGAVGRDARSAARADRRRDHGRRHDGQIRGMYIMGENPAMSDPDVEHARQALAELEMLVVQDIFLTETAYLADVILPAIGVSGEDRHVHQHRPPRAARTPGAGAARRSAADLDIIIAMAQRARARLALRASARSVRRDAPGDAVDRRHHVGAPRARERGHVSVRAGRRPGPARRVHRAISRRRPAARSSSPPHHSAQPSGPTPSIRSC